MLAVAGTSGTKRYYEPREATKESQKGFHGSGMVGGITCRMVEERGQCFGNTTETEWKCSYSGRLQDRLSAGGGDPGACHVRAGLVLAGLKLESGPSESAGARFALQKNWRMMHPIHMGVCTTSSLSKLNQLAIVPIQLVAGPIPKQDYRTVSRVGTHL